MKLRNIWQKNFGTATVTKAPHLSGSSSNAAADTPAWSPWTLTFRQASLESAYRQHHNARAKVLDQQAAWVYFSMIATGSLLYVCIFALLPQQHKQYHKPSNSCGELILISWLGCGLHLVLLLLLPEQQYVRRRTGITLVLRLLYLLGTARSYGQCHVGRAATHEESLFSAGVWRSGLVGLLWYAGAFPLLFWQHCLVQGVFLLAYWASLAPAVCADIAHVQGGMEALITTARTAQLLWSQLLAAAGATHTTAAAGSAALQTAGTSSYGCLQQVRWVQFALGYALPTFVLYCYEAHCRAKWQQQQWRAAKHVQLCTLVAQRRQGCSGSNSSGSWSDSSSNNEVAAAAAHAAAVDSKMCLFCGLQVSLMPAAGTAAEASASMLCSSNGAMQSLNNNLLHDRDKQGSSALQSQQQHRNSYARDDLPEGCSSHVKQLLQQQQQDNVDQPICSCAAGGFCPDVFYLECQHAQLPPSARELYLLLLSLGLVWFGLRVVG